MYKCKECGLLISEHFSKCPKCNHEIDTIQVDMDDEEEVVYKLSMEDIDWVLDQNFSKKEAKAIRTNYSNEALKDLVSRKLDIPWDEYIQCLIQCRCLDDIDEEEINNQEVEEDEDEECDEEDEENNED